MSGKGRLSLRARLLILLIAVTTAFLLVMGAVTTLVLSRRLSQQFNSDLIAYAARMPQDLPGGAGGYLAAAFSIRTGTSVLYTPGTEGRQLEQLISGTPRPELRQDFAHEPVTLVLGDGTRLRAVADRPRALPAEPDGGHRTADHHPGRPCCADARRR